MTNSTPSITSKHRTRKPRLTALQRRILDAGTPEIRKAVDALARYARRNARPFEEHPDGHFDKAHRWYPSAKENCGITGTIRNPSRTWAFSLLKACRTLKHCTALEQADPDLVLDVRREARAAGFGDTFDAATASTVLAHIDGLLSATLPPAVVATAARARL